MPGTGNPRGPSPSANRRLHVTSCPKLSRGPWRGVSRRSSQPAARAWVTSARVRTRQGASPHAERRRAAFGSQGRRDRPNDLLRRRGRALGDRVPDRIPRHEAPRRVCRRRALAGEVDALEANLLEASGAQQLGDLRLVVEAEGEVVEGRRIGGKEAGDRVARDTRGRVLCKRPPAAEGHASARAKHAPHFAQRARLVGEEHHAELADDEVEARVREGELLGVGRSPADAPFARERARVVEHGCVQVGGRQCGRRREGRAERPGQDPGSGGELEDGAHAAEIEALHEARRVRREEERSQVALVGGRDRARELCLSAAHAAGAGASPCRRRAAPLRQAIQSRAPASGFASPCAGSR